MRCALDEPRVRVAQHVYRNAQWIRKLSRGMGELFLGPRVSPPAPPLIEEHEEESRQAEGAGDRANSAAAVDTAGVSMGSLREMRAFSYSPPF
jgi:hypothetical protein